MQATVVSLRQMAKLLCSFKSNRNSTNQGNNKLPCPSWRVPTSNIHITVKSGIEFCNSLLQTTCPFTLFIKYFYLFYIQTTASPPSSPLLPFLPVPSLYNPILRKGKISHGSPVSMADLVKAGPSSFPLHQG